MAVLHRTKTADHVVEYVIDQLFSGNLRSGDRIDINALAEELGLSRVPVREGLLILEHDGLVKLPLHKGAFVAEFDERAVAEAFDLYGLLSSVASRTTAQVASESQRRLLRTLADAAIASDSADSFEANARSFRREINEIGGGPRLRATIKTFAALIPAASRFSIDTAADQEKAFVAAEIAAIEAADAEASARAITDHIDYLKMTALRELRARNVI